MTLSMDTKNCLKNYKNKTSTVIQKLDNKASEGLINAIRKNKLEYQLAPPDSHRPLPAERAIQTFKNHFIAALYGVDNIFPGNQWD